MAKSRLQSSILPYNDESIGESDEYRRLWKEVVRQTLRDAETILSASLSQYIAKGRVMKVYQYRMQSLMHEMSSDWFEEICDWAGFHRDFILRRVKAMIVRYKFDQFDFYDRTYGWT